MSLRALLNELTHKTSHRWLNDEEALPEADKIVIPEVGQVQCDSEEGCQ